MVFKILKSNYEAMTDNYNISLSFTYGRSVVFFANKTDHQEITDSVNNHKTNTFLQEYRVYIVFSCISSIHFNPPKIFSVVTGEMHMETIHVFGSDI